MGEQCDIWDSKSCGITALLTAVSGIAPLRSDTHSTDVLYRESVQLFSPMEAGILNVSETEQPGGGRGLVRAESWRWAGPSRNISHICT